MSYLLHSCAMETKFCLLTLSLLLLPLLLLLFLLKEKFQQRLKSPPGPRKLPVIGNLHQLGKLPHRSLQELSKKHGPLMFLQLGQIPTLVVSSAKMAKEFMKTHDLEFLDRPTSVATKLIFYGCTDLVFSPYGEYWRQARKICVLELFSVRRVQSFRFIMVEEVSQLISSIFSSSSSSKLVNITELVVSLANNIICRAAFSKTYGEGEDKSRIYEILKETQNLIGGYCVGDFFPCLEWINMITGLQSRLVKNFSYLDSFYEEVIEEHLDQNRPRPEQEDFVDVLLRVQMDQSLGIPLTRDHIKAILTDIFIAGTDTSSATVVWTMTELMRNPRTMRKAQDEVRKIVGKKEKIEESDLQQLNYLKSLIKETFRLHSPVPLLVGRQSITKCKIDGYEILPKTRVLVNAWAIGRDPQSWEKPEEFWPERFMNSSIDFKGRDFELIPFGAGRRSCPAISLATTTIELVLANLLHSFDWELPPGVSREELDMNEDCGITVHKKSPLSLVASFHNHH